MALALLLAMLVGLVGSFQASSAASGSLDAIDHGMVGMSAERGHADPLPTGKPVHEGTAEGNEREAEDHELSFERGHFAVAGPTYADLPSTMGPPPLLRGRFVVERVGARGPPLG